MSSNSVFTDTRPCFPDEYTAIGHGERFPKEFLSRTQSNTRAVAKPSTSNRLSLFVSNIFWPAIFSWIGYMSDLLPGDVAAAYVMGCVITAAALYHGYYCGQKRK
jgi:hypothetical protein